MSEHQNIEYKESWHEDYLKQICGFANADGGSLYIGRNDDGKVVGVADYKKLMEDLPNKILQMMGIMVEVHLHKDNNRHYIEIITPPYSVPISLRGRYYYRSGSTKQELTGNSLNGFLLKKSGKTWDDVIEQRATLADIDEKSVKQFLVDAKNAGRLPEDENSPVPVLLDKLRLIENGQLKRAAIVLFGKDPGRFYANMRVRIGRFGKTEDDLKFEESEEGNIVHCIQEVIAQLNRKFFIKSIDFEGVHRIEKGEYPVAALREMLLNALVHRDYMGSNIQIKMYDDRFSIWNEGSLPEGWNSLLLKEQHPSRPRNPIIADVCFKGGFIDAWGRGIAKIFNACKNAELPEPEIKEHAGGLLVTLFKDVYTQESLLKMELNERQIEVVKFVRERGRIDNKIYQDLFGISKRQATNDLNDLEKKSVLERVGTTGRGTYYILRGIKGAKGAQKGH